MRIEKKQNRYHSHEIMSIKIRKNVYIRDMKLTR